MIGENRVINGDSWTIVDVAPAEQLSEMVAALLEDAGFVALVRGSDSGDDVFAHLGMPGIGASVVLVPENQAEAALQLIRETVTDYSGDNLEEALESGELTPEDLEEGLPEGDSGGE
ncbi:MAG TPA: hypothetical protein VK092_00560 [Deinococcales bacterium]|nr:hypothetical protein [Deinococcales bacterium]